MSNQEKVEISTLSNKIAMAIFLVSYERSG
jgi:hypothetical protein